MYIMKQYKVKDKIQLFPQKGGWYYVQMPKSITTELNHLADRGLIPIIAIVGSSTWNTSLLPKGDGTHFIALNKKVMKRESLELNMEIEISFEIRN